MKLLATSVVRGSQQGESHGGVYLLDVQHQTVKQTVDWNTVDIDWQGRGWDRGLRGIAFDGEHVFIAASDELFAFTSNFQPVGSWRNAYLKHCHEICVHERSLFLTSTGFDSILAFDLDSLRFHWGMHVQRKGYEFAVHRFDPQTDAGPLMVNAMHINNVHCNENGMYISGLKSSGMLHFNGTTINMAVELPSGIHNAQPFRDGVLFNDTEDNVLRYSGRGEGKEDRALSVPMPKVKDLERFELNDGHTARVGFARGLCVLSSSVVAGGSSPSTVSLYNLAANEKIMSVTLSKDIRNAIHGLEVWPFD